MLDIGMASDLNDKEHLIYYNVKIFIFYMYVCMCSSIQGVCTDSVATTRKLQNGETVQMIRGSEQDGRHQVAD